MRQPEMVPEIGEIIRTAVLGEVVVNLNINNRAGGNAPLICQVIAEKFLAEQQFSPLKQVNFR